MDAPGLWWIDDDGTFVDSAPEPEVATKISEYVRALSPASRRGAHRFTIDQPKPHGFDWSYDVWMRPLPEGAGGGFAVAITERRTSDAYELARFNLALEATKDAVWEWVVGTEDVWWNPRAAHILGYPVGYPSSLEAWTDRIHPEDRPAVLETYQEALESEARVWEKQYRIVRVDGTILEVIDRGIVERDSNGNAIRLVGVMTDITEKRRLEQEILQTRKLDSIGRLAGGVAHDFNNLLTVILSASEFALDRLSSGESAKEEVEEVIGAATRATNLTSQLLSFARRQMIRPERLDLNELTEDMDKLLRRVIGEHIQLVTILSPDLGPVLSDRGQIEQVLMNLAVNARDAMPDGGRLTLETSNMTVDAPYASRHADLRPGQYVMIAVTDTGPGIPLELQEQIFEPFFTTKRPGEGTGLGLASSYGIVRQAGGQILLYSEEGRGTTFKILLPRTEAAEASSPTATSDVHLHGSETILFVEDDPWVRRVGSRALVQKGYKLIVASDGVEALDLLVERAEPIHMLVTDVVMPKLGGRELAERISEASPKTLVLFTSGYADRAIVHHGVLDAGVAFLPKPYSPRALLTRVRQLLDDRD